MKTLKLDSKGFWATMYDDFYCKSGCMPSDICSYRRGSIGLALLLPLILPFYLTIKLIAWIMREDDGDMGGGNYALFSTIIYAGGLVFIAKFFGNSTEVFFDYYGWALWYALSPIVIGICLGIVVGIAVVIAYFIGWINSLVEDYQDKRESAKHIKELSGQSYFVKRVIKHKERKPSVIKEFWKSAKNKYCHKIEWK